MVYCRAFSEQCVTVAKIVHGVLYLVLSSKHLMYTYPSA